MSQLYHFLARSDHPVAQCARRIYEAFHGFTLPAPRVVVRPALWIFLALRTLYWFGKRVFVCEPLFKAYCKQYGRRVRTGVYLHWVQGAGDIILGDDVRVDGKCTFTFASRFSSNPTLTVGDHTTIAHNCTFTVGKRITIGRHCLIAANVWVFDSGGHPSDPEARRAGLPPPAEEVRPVVIEDDVWIGRGSIICPGVTVGAGSVVAAGSVVMSDVRPGTTVAGYPARKISLTPGWRAAVLGAGPASLSEHLESPSEATPRRADLRVSRLPGLEGTA